MEDVLDRRARAWRLLVAAIVGGAAGVGVVWLFAQVLDHDSSAAPAWFAIFSWAMTFVLVTLGVNAALAAVGKRRWRPFPTARVVRR